MRKSAPPTTATVTPAFPACRRRGFNPTIFEEFQDIFGDFFGFEDVFGRSGGPRAASRVQRGADLRYDMG